MTTVKKPKAILYFEKELNEIKDTELNAFFVNALSVAPSDFHTDKELLHLVKKAYMIMDSLLTQNNVAGQVKEAMLGTVLIAKILEHEFRAPFKHLGAIAVRAFLADKKINNLPTGLWENIMRAVEAHEGPNSASILLEPRPGTAEHQVYMAYRIAKMDFLQLKIEEDKKEVK